ncbi:MerR family transcriptional regulator [Streptomyces atratus]
MAPARDGAGRRRYGTDDLTRVGVVVLAEQAGLGPDAIRVPVFAADPDERRAVLVGEAARLRTRIAAAQASLDLVECAPGCEHGDFTRYPHYRTHVALGLRAPRAYATPRASWLRPWSCTARSPCRCRDGAG